MSKISEKRGKSWAQGFHLKESKVLARDPDLQFITYHINIVASKKSDSSSSGNKHFEIDTKTREDMIQFLNFVLEEKINQQENE